MTDEMPATETSVRLVGYMWQVVFLFIFPFFFSLLTSFLVSIFSHISSTSYSIFPSLLSDIPFFTFHPLSLFSIFDTVEELTGSGYGFYLKWAALRMYTPLPHEGISHREFTKHAETPFAVFSPIIYRTHSQKDNRVKVLFASQGLWLWVWCQDGFAKPRLWLLCRK